MLNEGIVQRKEKIEEFQKKINEVIAFYQSSESSCSWATETYVLLMFKPGQLLTL